MCVLNDKKIKIVKNPITEFIPVNLAANSVYCTAWEAGNKNLK